MSEADCRNLKVICEASGLQTCAVLETFRQRLVSASRRKSSTVFDDLRAPKAPPRPKAKPPRPRRKSDAALVFVRPQAKGNSRNTRSKASPAGLTWKTSEMPPTAPCEPSDPSLKCREPTSQAAKGQRQLIRSSQTQSQLGVAVIKDSKRFGINPGNRGLGAASLPTRTQTIKSFASESTRLGEIPLQKWPVQPDWDYMERVNSDLDSFQSPSTHTKAGRSRLGMFSRLFKASRRG